MTKDDAIQILWEGRDGLLPMDIAREVAAAFDYKKPLPFKTVQQLRAEGVFLESKGPELEAGQGAVYQSFLPEGVLTCDLLEDMTGLGPPKVFPGFSNIAQVLTWRTQRCLLDGLGVRLDVGWIYHK